MVLQRKAAQAAYYGRDHIIINDPCREPLPETAKQPATHKFMHFIEEHAQVLRRIAQVEPEAVLDPYKLAPLFGATIKRPDEIADLTPDDLAVLANIDARYWSCTGIPLPNGEIWIILNPSQTRERERVTFLEEITHAYFKHEPSKLIQLPNGLAKRSFNPRIEQEAYWTAAAALLPALVVAKAVWRQQSKQAVARKYGVSTELVEFRLRTLQLRPHYLKYAMNSVEK